MTTVSSGSAWTSCRACGWSGGPFSYLVVETWVSSSPDYLQIRAACPKCGGEVPRR
jgi:hypothetical protein